MASEHFQGRKLLVLYMQFLKNILQYEFTTEITSAVELYTDLVPLLTTLTTFSRVKTALTPRATTQAH